MTRQEGQMLTTEEWLDEFMMQGQTEQIALVERMFKSAEAEQRCFIQDHKGAMRFARQHRCPAPHRGRRTAKLVRHFK